MTTKIGNTELNNNTVNKILKGKNNTTNQKRLSNSDKLKKLGFGSRDLEKEFKDFGGEKKIINIDNILMQRDEIVRVLEAKKFDKKKCFKQVHNTIIRPQPYSYTENMPDTIMDLDSFGLNRNLKAKGKYYTIKDEISYYEVENILKEFRTKYTYFKFNKKVYVIKDIKYQSIEISTYISQTLRYLLLNFLVEFNVKVKKANLNKYHPFTPFKIINVNLMRLLYNEQINVYRFVLTSELYRQKRNSINMYMEIIYKSDKDIIIYDKIYNMGVRLDEQIAFNKIANKKNNNYLSIHDFTNEKAETDHKIIKEDEDINEFLKKREEEYDLDFYLSQFKCYNPNAPNGIDRDSVTREDCLSYSHQYKCPGKWDIPCQTNDECPFYKANKNYENERGGCNDGYCEMPVNVGNVGHHYMDKNKPICYNCKKIGDNKNCKGIQCNQCCEEQKNRYMYPELDTPDFAFDDDYAARVNHQEILATRNLLPNKLL